MHGIEGVGNAAEIQRQFAVIVQRQADSVDIGLQAGLKKQRLVGVVVQFVVGFVDDFDDVFGLFVRCVIQRGDCWPVKLSRMPTL